MSLAEAKKLEDLKQKANELWGSYYSGLNAQRSAAIVSALDSMIDYLKEQGFDVQTDAQIARGFLATYKGITIKAEASGDDEAFIGADYVINITVGKSDKTQVTLNVKRGKRINQPFSHESVADQIKDYENRYIPEIEALDPSELDGSYNLSVTEVAGNNHRIKNFSTGKDVIEYLFDKKL